VTLLSLRPTLIYFRYPWFLLTMDYPLDNLSDSVAALVNKLVFWAWLLSGALEIWILRSRLRFIEWWGRSILWRCSLQQQSLKRKPEKTPQNAVSILVTAKHGYTSWSAFGGTCGAQHLRAVDLLGDRLQTFSRDSALQGESLKAQLQLRYSPKRKVWQIKFCC